MIQSPNIEYWDEILCTDRTRRWIMKSSYSNSYTTKKIIVEMRYSHWRLKNVRQIFSEETFDRVTKVWPFGRVNQSRCTNWTHSYPYTIWDNCDHCNNWELHIYSKKKVYTYKKTYVKFFLLHSLVYSRTSVIVQSPRSHILVTGHG